MDNNNQRHTDFLKMDFGTMVSSTYQQTVEVIVDENFLINDLSKAVAQDLHRRNPLRFEAVSRQVPVLNIPNVETVEDAIRYYIKGLLRIRFQCIADHCRIWRIAKQLGIPAYVQFVLSEVGIVLDSVHGRRIQPVIADDEVDVHALVGIYELLTTFKEDGVTFLEDAFPRTRYGNEETMSYAIIDGYVKGIERGNVARSYIAVFLGSRLKEEAAWKNLFSVRYDDVEYVKEMLIKEIRSW